MHKKLCKLLIIILKHKYRDELRPRRGPIWELWWLELSRVGDGMEVTLCIGKICYMPRRKAKGLNRQRMLHSQGRITLLPSYKLLKNISFPSLKKLLHLKNIFFIGGYQLHLDFSATFKT